MPAFPRLQGEAIGAIAKFLFEGEDIPAGAPDRRRSTCRIGLPVIAAGSTRRVIPRWPCPGERSTPSSSRPANMRGAFRSANFPNSRRKGIKETGSENYGGPLVTSGGLLFIGATHPRPQIPRVRQAQRQTTVGSGVAATPPMPRPSPTRWTDGSTSRFSRVEARSAAAREGGVYPGVCAARQSSSLPARHEVQRDTEFMQ